MSAAMHAPASRDTIPKHVIDTGHSDMIHDVQADYYGRRIATCSSDRSIKIFETDGAGGKIFEAELLGHDGPVWQVAWAHPKFGSYLASVGFDRRVILWSEASKGVWRKSYEYLWHASSVNALAFAPHPLGLALAVASSDGFASVLSHNPATNSWTERRLAEPAASPPGPPAHPMGVTSISWAPAVAPSALWVRDAPQGAAAASAAPSAAPWPKRIATAGCDGLVKIWREDPASGDWLPDGAPLAAHADWVRAVAWAPSIGLAASTIASCGQDGKVVLWTREEGAEGGGAEEWKPVELPRFEGPVWSVSWAPTGHVLGVASGDDRLSLWKERLDGSWANISDLIEAEGGAANAPGAPQGVPVGAPATGH